MYPGLVVVLVATRRSVLERSIDMKTAISSNVRFATNPGTRGGRSGAAYSRHLAHQEGDDNDETRPEHFRLLEVSLGTGLDLGDMRPGSGDATGDSMTAGASSYSNCDDKIGPLAVPRRALLMSDLA